MIKTPAAINNNIETTLAIYDAMWSPLSLRSAKAAYKDSKNKLITAHQIVHKSVLFHSST